MRRGIIAVSKCQLDRLGVDVFSDENRRKKMLKCLDCGHIFEKGEEDRWEEPRGEFWGQPVTETVTGCPCCGGVYEETQPCSVCHSEQLKNDLYGGICKECLSKYENDLDICLKLGEVSKEDIEINSLLVTMFTQAEIEEILIRELKEAEKTAPVDCSSFVYDDLDWFGETLRKEVLDNA